MSVETYPEDMLIALSDLLLLFEKGVVIIGCLLEWIRKLGVDCVESQRLFFYALDAHQRSEAQ
jgi:hypothetical protein